MSTKDSKIISEELKSKGNQFFSQGNYQEAIKYYSEAIDADSSNAVLFSNRAFANIKLKRFFQAEQDCTLALELNTSFDKAFYRRGLARKELKRYKSALEDFKNALKLLPSNSEIKNEHNSLKRLLDGTSKIRIDPIQKENQFKSSSCLKQVFIENADNPTTDIDTDLSLQIKKLVTNHVPKTYGQFEFDWRQLSQNSKEDKLEYLERINICDLENIFAYPFESKMLYEVIQILNISKNQLFVWQVLQLIVKMPRFTLNVCFFGNEEFEDTIFQDVLKSTLVEREKVVSLANMFNLKIN